MPRFFDAAAEWHFGKVLAVILACYTLGIICFALGRLIQSHTFRRFTNGKLVELFKVYGLGDHFKRYGSGGGGPDQARNLTLLWTEVRQNKTLAPSFSLLLRYWVMSALYDGMAIACLAWAAVIGINAEVASRFVLAGAAVLLAALCLWEGHRYYKTQIFELLAVVAYESKRLAHLASTEPSESSQAATQGR